MTLKASRSKHTNRSLTIALVAIITIAAVLTYFSQANFVFKTNAVTAIKQVPKQSVPTTNTTSTNQTNPDSTTNSSYTNPSTPIIANPVSYIPQNVVAFQRANLNPFTFSVIDNIDQSQTTDTSAILPINETSNNATDSLNPSGLDNNVPSPTVVTISLNSSDFITYAYGGFPVQQLDSTQFSFSCPNSTNQGEMAGSDALTLNNFSIQKLDFDAVFVTPQVNALGFDEMVIFATSDTVTYKGTEFGIRMDLKDGSVYGYIQEPNGNTGEVSFEMLALMPNDGITHHYTLIMLGSEVSFNIDGINYSYLNFPSNTDYSNLNFSVCAVVHRFTDNWDSGGDNMITGNFTLNQQ